MPDYRALYGAVAVGAFAGSFSPAWAPVVRNEITITYFSVWQTAAQGHFAALAGVVVLLAGVALCGWEATGARSRLSRSIVIGALAVAGAALLLLRPGFAGNPPDLSATGSWLLGVAIFAVGTAAAQVISLKRAAATRITVANRTPGSDTRS